MVGAKLNADIAFLFLLRFACDAVELQPSLPVAAAGVMAPTANLRSLVLEDVEEDPPPELLFLRVPKTSPVRGCLWRLSLLSMRGGAHMSGAQRSFQGTAHGRNP